MKDIDEMDILTYMDIVMRRLDKTEEVQVGYADELYL